MSDKQNENNKLAKKLVEINFEDRRDMQYLAIKKWNAGIVTGTEAIEEILDLEKIIYIDINILRQAKGRKPSKGKP